MSVPTNDSDKKSAAFDGVSIAWNASEQIQDAYWAVNATSYSNKGTALSAIDDLYDAWVAARSAVNGLS
jgi:hypothetical protein